MLAYMAPVCQKTSEVPSDWLGRLTLMISFVSKGFPYKDHIKELFIVKWFHFMYS